MKQENSQWQQRRGWESCEMRSDSKKELVGAWLFAIFWNALSSPVLFLIVAELKHGNNLAIIGMLFPLIGAGLLYRAVLRTMEYCRFGKASLNMDPYPGSIGGQVGGTIELSGLTLYNATAPESEISVQLECVHSYVSGSGDNRRRREDLKWLEKGEPHIRSISRGVQLSFCFDIPENLPESDTKQRDSYNMWRLTIKGQVPGVDFKRSYNIPVYKTAEASSAVLESISAQVTERQKEKVEERQKSMSRGDFDFDGLSRAMSVTKKSDELRLYFPMFRNKTLTLISAVFSGGFGTAVFFMLSGALGKSGTHWFMLLFSIPFGLVALFAGIATIYIPFNNFRVIIRRAGLHTRRRLFIIPLVHNHLKVDDIKTLKTKVSGSTGQGAQKVTHYKIMAYHSNGKNYTVAEDIDGREVAEQFRDYLVAYMGLGSAIEAE